MGLCRLALPWMALLFLPPARAAITVPPLEQLRFQVGEIGRLRFAPRAGLRVSRKNIIDLQQTGPEEWRLIALKKGLVIITESDAGGVERSRRLVQVVGRDEKVDGRPAPAWRRDLCAVPSVRCRGGRITGTTDDWRLLEHARELCRHRGACRLHLRLTPAARRAMEEDLARQLDHPPGLVVNELGRAVLSVRCGGGGLKPARELADHLSGGRVGRGTLLVRCRQGPPAAVLRLRLFYLEDEEGRQLGIDLQPADLFAGEADPGKRLRAFLQRNRSRILGEARVRLAHGVTTVVRHGSELRMESRGTEAADFWRRTGLEAEVTGHFPEPDRVLLDYDVRLSYPGDGAAGRLLQSSSLKGRLVLRAGGGRIAATISSRTLMARRTGLALISGLPLVGPLFGLLEEGSGRSRVYLWLALEEGEPSLGPLPEDQEFGESQR